MYVIDIRISLEGCITAARADASNLDDKIAEWLKNWFIDLEANRCANTSSLDYDFARVLCLFEASYWNKEVFPSLFRVLKRPDFIKFHKIIHVGLNNSMYNHLPQHHEGILQFIEEFFIPDKSLTTQQKIGVMQRIIQILAVKIHESSEPVRNEQYKAWLRLMIRCGCHALINPSSTERGI